LIRSAKLEQQVVGLSYASLYAVLDRDDAVIGRAGLDGGEDREERSHRHRDEFLAEELRCGFLAVRPELALEGYLDLPLAHFFASLSFLVRTGRNW
jgi:hypothetical protein